MDGRRFGAGLVGGLTVALLVVGISAFVSIGTLSGNLSKSVGSQVAVVSATNTMTSSMTGLVPVPGTIIQTTTLVSGNASNILSNMRSLQSNTTAATNAEGYGPTNGFSSSLASITQLPTTSRELLLAPILAAFLLGALLYHASSNKNGSEED